MDERIRILENAKKSGGAVAMIKAERKLLDERLGRKKTRY